jgi:pimeloyl-ACP methyl ester carboxylesterase
LRCGFVTVPEARPARPGGRTIKIAVAIARATAPAPQADPVVYLAGGPGGGGLGEGIELLGDPSNAFGALAADRDLILLDQRGTGFSQPSLACPETDSVAFGAADMMMMGELSPEARQALAACRARLVGQGIDLGQYTSAANADDVEDVRRALGHARWNLLGVSYGTRLALEILRRHPGGVRAAVLDSVLPAQVDFLADHAPGVARSLGMVLALCQAERRCNVYGDLEASLGLTLDRLALRPAELTVAGQRTSLTPRLFMDLITLLLYNRETIAVVPAVIFLAQIGMYDVVAMLLEVYEAASDDISLGMHLSVSCADEVPFSSRETVARAAVRIDRKVAPHLLPYQYFSMCALWNVPASPPDANQAITSAIPSLILAGELDPATPPSFAAVAAQTLSASHVVTFKGQAHGLLTSACGGQVIARFLRDPTRSPDDPCVTSLAGPMFVVP